jgi:outer membrane protein assembly factor BamB
MPTIRPLPAFLLMVSAACAGAALLNGCNALRLSQGVRLDPSDWPMDGRLPSRPALAAWWVVPPLVPAWQVDLGSAVGKGPPVAADSFIVVGTLRGELLVFETRSGDRLGGLSFGDGISGSPALGENIAYIPLANSAESIVAYDLSRGMVLWKQSCGDIATSPLLLDHHLYAGTTAGDLLCLDTESGTVVWQYELPANRTKKGIRSTPASDSALVVFGADDGHVYALDARLGTLRWCTDTGAPVMAGVALAGGRAFVGNLAGDMMGIDLSDGAVRWTSPAGHPIYAAAALADGLMISGTTGGSVHALRQDTGSKVWERNVGGVVSASGVISGSLFFVGTLGRTITALRLSDGSVAWKDSLEGRVKTAPVVARERLLVVTDERVLRAYRAEAP